MALLAMQICFSLRHCRAASPLLMPPLARQYADAGGAKKYRRRLSCHAAALSADADFAPSSMPLTFRRCFVAFLKKRFA